MFTLFRDLIEHFGKTFTQSLMKHWMGNSGS